MPELLEIGYINPDRWQNIADVFVQLGMAPGSYSLDGFIYDSNPAADQVLDSSILNEKEWAYLKAKKVIKMCNNPNWAPIEFARDGDLHNMQGIAIDTLKILEEKLDVKFENVPTGSWAESQQFLKEKKCDILPCAIKTGKREEYANFTKPYLNLPLAIFTTKDKKVVSGLDEIMDKPWTRQKGSGLIAKLREEYPEMKVIETKGDKEALQYVNSGNAYFTIATLPVASHVISKYLLSDLQVAGYTAMMYKLSMAVRDDDGILLSILNKALADISKDKTKEIFRKWVSASVKEPITNYKLLAQILSAAFIILMFFVYRQSVLNKNIAKLKKAEKWANEEKERLAVTLRSIGDGVITTDLDGKIVLLNKISEKLTGWSQQEAIGKQIKEVFNIINEQTGEPCDNPVDRVLATGQIVTLANHTVLISRNGAQYIIEDSGAPIFDQNSNVIGVVLVYRDVTEERKTKEELLKVKKLESVGVLAGGIAHDFNNILMAILGNIELADDCIDSTNEAHSLLLEAKKASIRAQDLTQQLLTFSKGGDPVKKTAAIDKVIIDSANFVLHGSSVGCTYNISEDLWRVDVDTGQISQVIQNIIINARHAMPDGGVIEVSCENCDIKDENLSLPGEKYIKISIADTGTGIPAKFIDRIFDPYFTTKGRGDVKGSGLGLAICHSIISKHDGTITVQSEAGKGSTFTIYLPASLEKAVQDSDAPQRGIVKAERQATIMVMDDELMVLDIAKRMLERIGHNVVLAANGQEAIELYRDYLKNDRSIDLIVMDLTIPGGLGGKDAISEILRINPDAKVVVASGYSNDPIMTNCQEYGFKASIAKPFQITALNKLINSVLE
jgi:PAS domain S-box-containing protein